MNHLRQHAILCANDTRIDHVRWNRFRSRFGPLQRAVYLFRVAAWAGASDAFVRSLHGDFHLQAKGNATGNIQQPVRRVSSATVGVLRIDRRPILVVCSTSLFVHDSFLMNCRGGVVTNGRCATVSVDQWTIANDLARKSSRIGTSDVIDHSQTTTR